MLWMLAVAVSSTVVNLLAFTLRGSDKHAWARDRKWVRIVAQRAVSFIHAVLVTVLGGLDTYAHVGAVSFFNNNTADQLWVCDISISYFFVDQLLDIVNGAIDIQYILHHTVGFSSISVLRFFSGRGGLWVTSSLMIGECTNPLQITWSTARDLKVSMLLGVYSAFELISIFDHCSIPRFIRRCLCPSLSPTRSLAAASSHPCLCTGCTTRGCPRARRRCGAGSLPRRTTRCASAS